MARNFLQLREEAVARWVSSGRHPRLEALEGAYRGGYNRARPRGGFPIARLTLIHTLSHMLIRQVALECGYSSASLRERVYSAYRASHGGRAALNRGQRQRGDARRPRRSRPRRYLGRLLGQAFDDACTAPPTRCAPSTCRDPSATLHAAACHACLFASETSCETNNRWLDRAVLADLTGDGLVFAQ